ncbi:Gfo/Idh/MocA family protein [Herbiconiux sp. L3-i23]|uniref:Gfo/Idh/MocA family protein n=1 Tax=Herbiconiux sp. L3-i23 TaxID=2905871 RepID=UPI0020468CCC|nr:Gfo/Idh/MocA family oxidoreductase [Herbiconiux sp. L3-i23]BDI22987.1 oxidoreductase [Herbiconiux sp. L3-i23]
MSATAGVGVLGCGPVTQAIHLPTLERVPEFHVARVMDINPEVAESVAGRVGAKWSTDADEVIADPDVDVVLVCSPNGFHAEQVIAACRAGKKAVLCEKPLAMTEEEAAEIARVSTETGVPVIVGAMHTFDPGWLAALDNWNEILTAAHTLRYSITLPPNPRFEDFATDIVGRPGPWQGGEFDADAAASMMSGSIMGLAIHDLPLIRMFCPDWEEAEVLSAQIIRSGGYLLHLRIGARNVRVAAVMTQTLQPEWRLEAIGDDIALDVDFPNSYVHYGSAVATLSRGTSAERVGPFEENGYVGEWRYLADLVNGRAEPIPIERLIDDVVFAIRIAGTGSTEVRDRFNREMETAR